MNLALYAQDHHFVPELPPTPSLILPQVVVSSSHQPLNDYIFKNKQFYWQYKYKLTDYDNYRFFLKQAEGLNPMGGNIQSGLRFLISRAQHKPIDHDIYSPY